MVVEVNIAVNHLIGFGKGRRFVAVNTFCFEDREEIFRLGVARRKILCKRFSTKSRMALENRADSGLDPLITESHGGQNGMCAGTA